MPLRSHSLHKVVGCPIGQHPPPGVPIRRATQRAKNSSKIWCIESGLHNKKTNYIQFLVIYFVGYFCPVKQRNQARECASTRKHKQGMATRLYTANDFLEDHGGQGHTSTLYPA